jgi:oxygen-independent coproporphyrinogen-3 oxidase
MSDLINRLDVRFGLTESRERDYAIEVNPREANVLTLRHLQALGFNRLILDIQDLDPAAQHTINRILPRAKVELLVDEAHRLHLDALTMELRIGLPFQTPDNLAGTLEQVIAMAPARVRVIPPPPRPQFILKALRHRGPGLSATDTVQTLMITSLERLVEAGYVHIGQGYFARPEDSLTLARDQGRLTMDLQGYAIAGSGVQLGLGVAAISRVDDVYARNALFPSGYERALDAGRLATACGRRLSFDERLRRDAIEGLVCDGTLDLKRLGDTFGVDGEAYLAASASWLEALERDGLVARQGQLVVTAAGRMLLGDIIRAFSADPRRTRGSGY